MTNTMTFRTVAQAAIFDLELQGQFSDGHWENLRGDHWQVWCRAEVKVGENVGRSFSAIKDNYNIAAKELLECVGERMKGYARVAMVLGLESANRYRYFVECDSGLLEVGEFNAETSDYYVQKNLLRAELLALSEDTLRKINDKDLYTEKMFRADLREMKKAMKTRV